MSGPSCYVPRLLEKDNDNDEENVSSKTKTKKVQTISNKQFAPNREFPSLTTVLTDLASPDFLNNDAS